MIYVVGNGAKQVLEAQRVTANNIANATTAGFKADLDYFSSKPVYGPGSPTRVYSAQQSASVDTSVGSIRQTGNPLDVALSDGGWMAVVAEDGTTGYSRRGDLRIDGNGVLRNGEGLMVLGDTGAPVALPPAEAIEFAQDGSVQVRLPGAQSFATLDRLMLVAPNPTDLQKSPDGLLRMKDGTQPPPDAGITVRGGHLEASNVNVVSSMVDLIEHGRAFEFQIKFLEQAESMDKSSARLLATPS